ncbi:hypothetical protein ABGB20_06600 [Streptomyces sp. B22F1]
MWWNRYITGLVPLREPRRWTTALVPAHSASYVNKAELVVAVVFAQMKGHPVAFLETFAYGVDTRSDRGFGLAFRVFGLLDGPTSPARELEQPPLVRRSGEDEAEGASGDSRGGTVHSREKCGLAGA